MNIFIFHRDLRLNDNTTLIEMIKNNQKVIPIFIFNKDQIDQKRNKYFSINSVRFMIESLKELSDEIKKYNGKLYFYYGENEKVIKEIIKNQDLNSIGFNYDYTPYAKKRDDNIINICNKHKQSFKQSLNVIVKEDIPLYEILEGQTKKVNNEPYMVYTPFKRHCMTNLKVRDVNKFNKFNNVFEKSKSLENKYSIDLKDIYNIINIPNDNQSFIIGGRSNGLKILKNIDNFTNYDKCRDILNYNTTFLGAHLHFNTVSIREVYHKFVEKLGIKSGLVNQLHWRDFYINITHFFPHVLKGQVSGKNKSFRENYDNIKWIKNKTLFEKWCNGNTGIPIIDAGMRQLNLTGYQHNRCRMICSSFLIKNLNIDWKEGECYYATKLVDYDPMNNSGGWQWSSGGGTDAQPYFRIFNPWTQAKKFDKDCIYIKRWIPELKDVPNKDILNWDKKYKDYDVYLEPIVDTSKTRTNTINLYKKYL
jgi:deoxyribodipyrimidine photo-lyase